MRQTFDTYPQSPQTSLSLPPASPGQHSARGSIVLGVVASAVHPASTETSAVPLVFASPLTRVSSLLLCGPPSSCILFAFLRHQEALHSSGPSLGRGASAQGTGCSRLAVLLVKHTHTTAHSCLWLQDTRQCGQELSHPALFPACEHSCSALRLALPTGFPCFSVPWLSSESGARSRAFSQEKTHREILPLHSN